MHAKHTLSLHDYTAQCADFGSDRYFHFFFLYLHQRSLVCGHTDDDGYTALVNCIRRWINEARICNSPATFAIIAGEKWKLFNENRINKIILCGAIARFSWKIMFIGEKFTLKNHHFLPSSVFITHKKMKSERMQKTATHNPRPKISLDGPRTCSVFTSHVLVSVCMIANSSVLTSNSSLWCRNFQQWNLPHTSS